MKRLLCAVALAGALSACGSSASPEASNVAAAGPAGAPVQASASTSAEPSGSVAVSHAPGKGKRDGDWELVAVHVGDDGRGVFGGSARIRYDGSAGNASGNFTLTVISRRSGNAAATFDVRITGANPGSDTDLALQSAAQYFPGRYDVQFNSNG